MRIRNNVYKEIGSVFRTYLRSKQKHRMQKKGGNKYGKGSRSDLLWD